MRILFQARSDILSVVGGDTIQLVATMKYLQRRGIDVHFDSSTSVDCSSFDAVHLFNITIPVQTSLQMLNAKSQDRPICLSTIYWRAYETETAVVKGVPPWFKGLKRLRDGLRRARGLFSEQKRIEVLEQKLSRSSVAKMHLQNELLDQADLLLPNSYAELELLHEDFPSCRAKAVCVVPNGVDSEVFRFDSIHERSWGKRSGLGSYVLCAARIDPRKNQLSLINAMAGSSIPVVLVGGSNNRAYRLEVKRAMRRKDLLLRGMTQRELRAIYASARVHVLPSFYETPGLASLEAGALGCNLVMSDIGCQKEYFGDSVVYCDPCSAKSIRSAVEEAWEWSWPNRELAETLIRKYTWGVAAEATHEAYTRLLAARGTF